MIKLDVAKMKQRLEETIKFVSMYERSVEWENNAKPEESRDQA